MDTIKVDREDFEALCVEYGVVQYLDYSGRGMFGETCVGAYSDSVGDLAAFMGAASELTDGDDVLWRRRVQRDSLGLSEIWYWPGIQAAG